jgi:hypothetical protein
MSGMNALTGTFRLSCPRHGDARVRLSSFRRIERLPGARHPALYRIEFGCGCGEEHPALLTQADLDCAPLGLDADETMFVNLMTSQRAGLAVELVEIASSRIRAGEWPWSFFCYLEERSRPVTPSSFTLLAAGGPNVALAVCCPCCGSVSINVVSRAHVDVPFANDTRIAVVAHVFAADALKTVDAFHDQLHSAVFDERRLELEP